MKGIKELIELLKDRDFAGRFMEPVTAFASTFDAYGIRILPEYVSYKPAFIEECRG